MTRRRRRRSSADVHLGFQIAPMIDVVFVIMLYFMVMAGSVRVENAHATKLPGRVDAASAVEMPDEIMLRVEDDGQVLLNDQPLDRPQDKRLPELAKNLALLRQSAEAAKTQVFVTVHATPAARYERVVDVLDALSVAGLDRVTFQAGDE